MAFDYRDVLDQYDAQHETGATADTLPEWSRKMNELTGTDLYSAGYHDNWVKRASVGIDRLLEKTGAPQAAGAVGREIGGLVGFPDVGEQVGHGLPRMAVNLAPMALGGAGGVIGKAAGYGLTAALAGAETYTATDSPLAGTIAGATFAGAPLAGRFLQQSVLKGLGATYLRGPIADATGKVIGQVDRGYVPQDFAQGFGKALGQRVAGFGAEQAGMLGAFTTGQEAEQIVKGEPLINPVSPEGLVSLGLTALPFSAFGLAERGVNRLTYGKPAPVGDVLKILEQSKKNIALKEAKAALEQAPGVTRQPGETREPDPVMIAETNELLESLRKNQLTIKDDPNMSDDDRWIAINKELSLENQATKEGFIPPKNAVFGTVPSEKAENRTEVIGHELKSNPNATWKAVYISNDPANPKELQGQIVGFSTLNMPAPMGGFQTQETGQMRWSLPAEKWWSFVKSPEEWARGGRMPQLRGFGEGRYPRQVATEDLLGEFPTQKELSAAELSDNLNELRKIHESVDNAQTPADYQQAVVALHGVEGRNDLPLTNDETVLKPIMTRLIKAGASPQDAAKNAVKAQTERVAKKLKAKSEELSAKEAASVSALMGRDPDELANAGFSVVDASHAGVVNREEEPGVQEVTDHTTDTAISALQQQQPAIMTAYKEAGGTENFDLAKDTTDFLSLVEGYGSRKKVLENAEGAAKLVTERRGEGLAWESDDIIEFMNRPHVVAMFNALDSTLTAEGSAKRSPTRPVPESSPNEDVIAKQDAFLNDYAQQRGYKSGDEMAVEAPIEWARGVDYWKREFAPAMGERAPVPPAILHVGGRKGTTLRDEMVNAFMDNFVKGQNVTDAFGGSGQLAHYAKVAGADNVMLNIRDPAMKAVFDDIKGNTEDFANRVAAAVEPIKATREMGAPTLKDGSPIEPYLNELAQSDPNVGLYLKQLFNMRGREIGGGRKFTPFRNMTEAGLSELPDRLREFAKSIDKVTGEDGWELVGNAKEGDRVLVDPPYVGTQKGFYHDTGQVDTQKQLDNYEKYLYPAAERGAKFVVFDIADPALKQSLEEHGFTVHEVQRTGRGGTETQPELMATNEPTVSAQALQNVMSPFRAPKTPRQLDIGIGLNEDRGSVAVRAPGGNKLKLDVNMQQLMNLVGPQMYSKPIAEVTVKELLQNALDASRAAGATNVKPKQIHITQDRETREISVADSGTGMTPDVIQKAFFTIGGTHKTTDPENTSGGLGLAKMAFILGSKRIRLETVKNGVKSTVDATSEQIRHEAFDIKTEKTNEPNGTKVTVQIPETFKNSNGEDREIYMYGQPEFLNRPLFAPVEVTFNGDRLPLGVYTTGWQKDNVFNFSWGKIHVHVDPKKTSYPEFKILSAGLYQFKVDSGEVFGWSNTAKLPYDIVLDVRPNVRTDNVAYPFNNQREGFRGTIDKDIQAMYGYFRKQGVEQQLLEAKDTFANLKQLPEVDPTKALTQEQIDRINESYSRAKRTVKEYKPKKVTSVDVSGDNVILHYHGGETVTRPLEEYVSKSFKPERDVDLEKTQLDVSNLNPSTPYVHNNTSSDFSAIEGEKELSTMIGNSLIKFMREWGGKVKGEYDQLSDTSPAGWFGGLSYDRSYRGLNMVKPMKAIWFNLGNLSEDAMRSPEAAALESLHVFLHEITHVSARSEGSEFTAELANNHARIRAHGVEWEKFEQSLANIYAEHWDTINEINDKFNDYNTKNVAASFKSSAALSARERAEAAGVREGIPEVGAQGTEQLPEQRPGGAGGVGEADRTAGPIGEILDGLVVAGQDAAPRAPLKTGAQELIEQKGYAVKRDVSTGEPYLVDAKGNPAVMTPGDELHTLLGRVKMQENLQRNFPDKYAPKNEVEQAVYDRMGLARGGQGMVDYLLSSDHPYWKALGEALAPFKESLARIKGELRMVEGARIVPTRNNKYEIQFEPSTLLLHPDDIAWTMAHELIHGLTLSELHRPENIAISQGLDALSGRLVKALPADMRAAYHNAINTEWYRKFTQGQVEFESLMPKGTFEQRSILYGLMDQSELITQAFTTRGMRDFMNSVKAEKNVTAFDKFVGFVKLLLKYKDTDPTGTAFGELISYTNRLMSRGEYINNFRNFSERYFENLGTPKPFVDSNTQRATALVNSLNPFLTPGEIFDRFDLGAVIRSPEFLQASKELNQVFRQKGDEATETNKILDSLGAAGGSPGVRAVGEAMMLGALPNTEFALKALPEAAQKYILAYAKDAENILGAVDAGLQQGKGVLNIDQAEEVRPPVQALLKMVRDVTAFQDMHDIAVHNMQSLFGVTPAGILDAAVGDVKRAPVWAQDEPKQGVFDKVARWLEPVGQTARRIPEWAEHITKLWQVKANQHMMEKAARLPFGVNLETMTLDKDTAKNAGKLYANTKLTGAADRWIGLTQREGKKNGKTVPLDIDHPEVQKILSGLSDKERDNVDTIMHQRMLSNQAMQQVELEARLHIGSTQGARLVQKDMTQTKMKDAVRMSSDMINALIGDLSDPMFKQQSDAKIRELQQEMTPEAFNSLLKYSMNFAAHYGEHRKFLEENPDWANARRYGKFLVTYKSGGRTYLDGVNSEKEAIALAGDKRNIIKFDKNEKNADDMPPYLGPDAPAVVDKLRELEQNMREILIGKGVITRDDAEMMKKYSAAEQLATEETYRRGIPGLAPPARGLTKMREDFPWLRTHQAWIEKTANYWTRQKLRAERDFMVNSPEFAVNEDLKSYINDYTDNLLKPDTTLGKFIQRFATTWFLGFSPAAAMINGTQAFLTHAAELTAMHGNPLRSYRQVFSAIGELIAHGKTGNWGSEEHTKAMQRWTSEAEVGIGMYDDQAIAQETLHTNYMRAMNKQTPQTVGQQLSTLAGNYSNAAMWMFKGVEKLNNQIALLAGFDHYRSTGLSFEDAYQKAKDFNHSVNYSGGPLQRPVGLYKALPRSIAMTSTSMQSYVLGTTWQLVRYIKQGFFRPAGLKPSEVHAARTAAVQMLAVQLAAAGVLGLPFVSSALAVLDKSFPGLEVNRHLREWMNKLLGEDGDNGGTLTDMAMTGMPSMFGWDMQSRLSMGNTLPGVSEVNGFEPERLLGPPASLVTQFIQGGQKVVQGDIRGVDNLMPNFLKKIEQLLRSSGQVLDYRDRPVFSPTAGEVTGMVLGFQPKRLSDFNAAQRIAKQAQDNVTSREGAFHQQQAEDILRGNFGSVRNALLQRASEDKTYDPRAGARSIASAAEGLTYPRDLRNEGTTRGADVRGRLLSTFNLPATQPLETDRLQFQHQVQRRLGLTATPSSTDLRLAQLVDEMRRQDPNATRSELRRRASRLLHAPRLQTLASPSE